MSRKGPGNELEVGLQAPRTATAIDIEYDFHKLKGVKWI